MSAFMTTIIRYAPEVLLAFRTRPDCRKPGMQQRLRFSPANPPRSPFEKGGRSDTAVWRYLGLDEAQSLDGPSLFKGGTTGRIYSTAVVSRISRGSGKVTCSSAVTRSCTSPQ